jgi:hypothetical protein
VPIIDRWPAVPAAYTYAGGWTLQLESSGGPPVAVSEYPYESRARCEESRALAMRQAYYDFRSVPPLTCVSQYQGWRRLHVALQALNPPRYVK